MIDHYKNTIETWRKLASVYDEKFSVIRLYDSSYQAFISALTDAHPNILEIGCGPGTVTEWLKNHLPNATIYATDVAPEMIEFAKKKIEDVEFAVLDARNLQSIKNTYDGVLSGFCIPYLSKPDLVKFLETAVTKLNRNGILYLSFIEGDYENSTFQTGSTGDSMKVHFYSESAVSKMLIENKMTILDTIRVNYPLSDETHQTHIILIARKN